jgi:hypothetical protein
MNPNAAPRSRRRATERDFLFFQNPSSWRTHPFLPLTRRDLSCRPELGVLFDARSFDLHGYVCTVVLCNLFLLPSTVAELLALPRLVYDSFDELANEGWSVD